MLRHNPEGLRVQGFDFLEWVTKELGVIRREEKEVEKVEKTRGGEGKEKGKAQRGLGKQNKGGAGFRKMDGGSRVEGFRDADLGVSV